LSKIEAVEFENDKRTDRVSYEFDLMEFSLYLTKIDQI